MIKTRTWLLPILLSAGVLVPPAMANAQTSAPPPLPPVDLGQTNILDGEGAPGALLELISFGSIADRLADDEGDGVPGDNRQRIASFVLHPILVSSTVIAGAHPGMEVLVPISRVDNDFASGGSGERTGIGDTTLAPFLEWSPQKPGPGALSFRLALQIVAPTGSYGTARAVNTGQGSWQLSPYVATTWRASNEWEVSARAIYDWSGSARSTDLTGSTVRKQPGDLFALNVSASYALASTWRIGPAGYWLQQLDASRVGGQPIAASRERTFGLGLASRWQVGKASLLAAAFGEFEARNRPQGATLNLRLQFPL